MFERFGAQARQVVVSSQDEARQLRHDWIGTEHLLLGLLVDSSDVPARVLARHGLSLETARADVQGIIGTRDAVVSGHIPFTPQAKGVLQGAIRWVESLGHEDVEARHLALALLHEGEDVAVTVLTRSGVALDQVQQELVQQ